MIFDTGIEENLIRATMGGANLKTKSITENGKYKAADDGCDGYSEVDVDVQPKIYNHPTITENGIYLVPAEYDGFGDITVDVQSVGLDDIVKLPTCASYKVGAFEYLLKIGTAVGIMRNIGFSEYDNDVVLEMYRYYDYVYIVICENNVPILAYDHCEFVRKEEYYNYNGSLWYTDIYDIGSIAQNIIDRYNWTVKLKYSKTTKYPDTSEPETSNYTFTADPPTNPFLNKVMLYTSLSDASMINFAQRLYIALKSLS